MQDANRKFDFTKLLVDFPKPDELHTYWAEPIQLDVTAPYHGWGPIPWDIMDWRLDMPGCLCDVMKLIAQEVAGGLELVFILGKKYDLTAHIREVRSSREETAMMNSWRQPPYKPYAPPAMDILMLKDLATLSAMSQRSPYLALLQEVTSGQQEDQAWVYFLTRAEAGKYGDREGDLNYDLRKGGIDRGV